MWGGDNDARVRPVNDFDAAANDGGGGFPPEDDLHEAAGEQDGYWPRGLVDPQLLLSAAGAVGAAPGANAVLPKDGTCSQCHASRLGQ